jgi:hypothetical protein
MYVLHFLDPGQAHVGFMVDKLTLGQVFFSGTSIFPCQYHSTHAPQHVFIYHGSYINLETEGIFKTLLSPSAT